MGKQISAATKYTHIFYFYPWNIIIHIYILTDLSIIGNSIFSKISSSECIEGALEPSEGCADTWHGEPANMETFWVTSSAH